MAPVLSVTFTLHTWPRQGGTAVQAGISQDSTAVSTVFAVGSEIKVNFRFNICSFFVAISNFHKGCTLGTLLATPPKVGVPVRHEQSYLH